MLGVDIKRTISGPRKDAPFSRGVELMKARKTVLDTLRSGNKHLIEYTLAVAENIAQFKQQGDKLFIPRIKHLTDTVRKTMAKVGVGVSDETIRLINVYLQNLEPKEIERFIEKFQIT